VELERNFTVGFILYCSSWVGDEEGGGMRCERTVRIEKGCGGLRWDTIGW